MGGVQQTFTLGYRQVGGNQQYSRSPAQACLEQLVLIYHKVLVKDGDVYTAVTGRANKVVATAKILLVGKYAQCSSAILLVAQWDDVGLPLLLNPTL